MPTVFDLRCCIVDPGHGRRAASASSTTHSAALARHLGAFGLTAFCGPGLHTHVIPRLKGIAVPEIETEAAEAPVEAPEPRHLSYSALSDFLSCGKLHQLKRLLGLPDRPTWWNVGGHAVHSATEAYDRQLFAAYGT